MHTSFTTVHKHPEKHRRKTPIPKYFSPMDTKQNLSQCLCGVAGTEGCQLAVVPRACPTTGRSRGHSPRGGSHHQPGTAAQGTHCPSPRCTPAALKSHPTILLNFIIRIPRPHRCLPASCGGDALQESQIYPLSLHTR